MSRKFLSGIVRLKTMDTSFELLSSMSPKINRNIKPNRKPPTILALKKHIRRSSLIISHDDNSRKNESIVTIESSSTSTPESISSSKSPILISDSSETSFTYKKSVSHNSPVKIEKEAEDRKNEQNPIDQLLSQEKFSKIKYWVDEVNSAKKETSVFSEVSTICGEENPCFKVAGTNIAAHSTFLKPDSRRFDELFKNNHLNTINVIVKEPSENANIIINDSLITEDDSLENYHNSLVSEDNSLAENCKNMVLEDSFELDRNKDLSTPIMKKQSSINTEFKTPPNKAIASSDEYEDLLDGIYGNSWRQRKDDVLPSSEPQFKRKEKKTNNNVNTEKPAKALNVYKNPYLLDENESNDLLKTLQKTRFKKALESSPWMKSIQNLCDSDTDPEDPINFGLLSTKLEFNVENLTDKKKKSSKLQSHNKVQTESLKVINKTKTEESKTEPHYTFSFLASLSASIPVSKSDVSALIYRNNFKLHRVQLASKLFKLYNESIFNNDIPSDTPLEWNDRMRGTAGYCYCKKVTRRNGGIERAVRIVISSKVVDSADRLRDTLIHEMCHAVTWIVNHVADGHGSFWRSWADRAMIIFPELPPIKRCHQYVINTKYTYRCVDCGYSIGRHTKSLDVDRKRCGYCYGKFEILINKTTKKGETKTVSVTPKKAPTGFALFVKENYATYKTPDLKHADVMKMLSQKFSDLKVDKS